MESASYRTKELYREKLGYLLAAHLDFAIYCGPPQLATE